LIKEKRRCKIRGLKKGPTILLKKEHMRWVTYLRLENTCGKTMNMLQIIGLHGIILSWHEQRGHLPVELSWHVIVCNWECCGIQSRELGVGTKCSSII
jgi:hypothetical protein